MSRRRSAIALVALSAILAATAFSTTARARLTRAAVAS